MGCTNCTACVMMYISIVKGNLMPTLTATPPAASLPMTDWQAELRERVERRRALIEALREAIKRGPSPLPPSLQQETCPECGRVIPPEVTH